MLIRDPLFYNLDVQEAPAQWVPDIENNLLTPDMGRGICHSEGSAWTSALKSPTLKWL